MIYQITAGGRTFYTTDTDLIDVDTGIYYGTSNLQLRTSYDYSEDGFPTQYIYAGSRTVVYRTGYGYDTEYLTITDVVPLYDVYQRLEAGQNTDLLLLLCLGVCAVCQVFRLFFRH